MEEPYSVSKRKKRKTRKCLNELRKKSLRTAISSNKNVESGSKVNGNIPKIVEANHTKYITSNRLTLAVFPKAVRSETITRPVLAEIKHEPGNVNMNNIINNNHVPDEIVSAQIEEDDKGHNGSILFSIDEDSEEDKTERDDILAKLESPELTVSDEASRLPEPAPPRTPPPRTPPLRDRAAYLVYEQFVKNIPRYIQIYAPALLEEDAARRPVEIVRDLCSEEDRKLCESPDSRAQPYSARSPPATLSASPSPSPSPQLSQGIQDTPDYTYFPHKLNE